MVRRVGDFQCRAAITDNDARVTGSRHLSVAIALYRETRVYLQPEISFSAAVTPLSEKT